MHSAHPQVENSEHPTRSSSHRAVLVATLLFVLAAVSVSTGLVVFTAWLHDLKNGVFALLFATLSARAVLSWCLWSSQSVDQSFSRSASQQEGRKPADEATQ